MIALSCELTGAGDREKFSWFSVILTGMAMKDLKASGSIQGAPGARSCTRSPEQSRTKRKPTLEGVGFHF
jgi:hypothetical protein